MANASRVKLHQWRKRAVGALEHLWPARRLEAESEVLHHQVRMRIPVAEADPALPPMPRAVYREWSVEPEEESIRRLRHPVTVDPEMGILFQRGRILWGSSDMPPRERAARFPAHLLPPGRRLERAILLHHVFGNNYFHFYCYVIGKLYVAERAGMDPAIPLLIPEHTAAMPFFEQARALGLFGDRQIVVQGRTEVIGVDEAYLIRNYDCLYEGFEWMRTRMPVSAEAAPERPLFVVRGKGALNARQYRNQAELDAIATGLGFDLFDPAEHSLKEQIARFSRANAIVSAHGAGLTNMMFRQGPCSILEIFSPTLGTPHYYLMARQRGFSYRWLMAQDPVGKANVATTSVSPEAFREALAGIVPPTR
jgi:Glycosyltransferase 61